MVSPALVTLGDGLVASRMGFGTMALTGVYGYSAHENDIATLNHALDIGVTFIDTADIYGDGRNELTVGEVAKHRRGEMTIATKVGISRSADGKSVRVINDATYIRKAVDESLGRLSVDVIDLLYLHRRDISIPIEDVVGTMSELVSKGKVRHLGLSEVIAPEIEAAQAVHPIAAIQSEWSVWSRDVEEHVVPTAAALGIGFVPYSPLGRGFLTGTISDAQQLHDDWRGSFSRFSGDALAINQTIVTTLNTVAKKYEATAAQIALSWLYATAKRKDIALAPIPGTRKKHRIDENIRSMTVTLDLDDMCALDALAADVVGERCDIDDPNWTSQRRERLISI